MKSQKTNVLKISVIFLIILFLGIMSAFITHAASYNFVKVIGSKGTGSNQFNSPMYATTDSSGNIYVADTGNSRIEIFDKNFNYFDKWGSGGSGNGQFFTPNGVAVDSMGNIYVADHNNHRVQKLDSTGGYISQFDSSTIGDGLSFYPVDLAVDSLDNVYVSDSRSNRIVKLNKDGNYLTQWGSKGASRNQFNDPEGVAVDSSGNIYVVDSGNSRIMKFDSTGTYLTEWGTPGREDGQFRHPHGIAIDSSGAIYVTDTGNRRIQKFDSTGSYVTKWVSPENGDGKFQNPVGIVVDSSNNVYVVDSFYHCVFQFVKSMSPTANFDSSVTSGSTPLPVKFTDLSENATGWYWDFGDGSTSTDQNPIHKYLTEETYTVKLTATNSAGGDTITKSNYISVKSGPQTPTTQPPVAEFTSSAKSVDGSLIVTFTDTSTGEPTSWLWDFGDGNTSTEQNPTHTYAESGDYHVTLIVSNSAGTNDSTKEVSPEWGLWQVVIGIISIVVAIIGIIKQKSKPPQDNKQQQKQLKNERESE